MALKTKPAKGTIQKQSFDIMAYQKSKGLTRTSKPKELSRDPLSEPYQEA
jgi:hypothetical protein